MSGLLSDTLPFPFMKKRKAESSTAFLSQDMSVFEHEDDASRPAIPAVYSAAVEVTLFRPMLRPIIAKGVGDEGLLLQSAEVSTEDTATDAQLRDAVTRNKPALLRTLLDRRISNKAKNALLSRRSKKKFDDDKPLLSELLHSAAELGLIEIIKMLVQAGADIEAPGSDDCCFKPLLKAVARGEAEVAMILLDLGADANACSSSSSHEETPLQMAVHNNDIKLVLALLKKGALVDFKSPATGGWTALHIAAALNRPTAMSALLKFGANPNNLDADGDTPLTTSCSLGHINCVQLLLAGGADPKQQNQVPLCAISHPK